MWGAPDSLVDLCTAFEPTYKRIGDHTEAILIEFNEELTFKDILEKFWREHAPGIAMRQYRSAVFYHDEAQKAAAETMQAQLIADGKKWCRHTAPLNPPCPSGRPRRVPPKVPGEDALDERDALRRGAEADPAAGFAGGPRRTTHDGRAPFLWVRGPDRGVVRRGPRAASGHAHVFFVALVVSVRAPGGEV